ncbi:MAG: peptidyl-prolyl cis-trans isomerase [Gammaproteobacteria bacterium]|nr:peptidyl-prolyl cis-trans isomerase [Gammaproteobacteria bacterium]
MNRHTRVAGVLAQVRSAGYSGRRKSSLQQPSSLIAWSKKLLLGNGLATLLVGSSVMVSAQPQVHQETQQSDTLFAIVNGEQIKQSAYDSILHIGSRNRFYHGKAPEELVIAYRNEVAALLIDQTLLHQEAVKRGIQPNPARVNDAIAKTAKRYVGDPGWERDKVRALPILREGFERGDRVRQLQEQLRAEVSAPTDTQLQAYYRANPETFTSPPQTRVAMIMLKVAAWADAQVWEKVRAKAERIHYEIGEGLEFSQAVQRYSEDGSVAADGDLGYLHQGMLSPQAEAAIAALEPGEFTAPVTLLEGVALFYLKDRKPAQLNSLESVRGRAESLWIRERKDQAVDAVTARLRERAEIRYFLPPADQFRPGRESTFGEPLS